MFRFARPFAVVAAATCLLLGMLVGPASASHSWSDYHWARTSNPMALQVVDNISPEWQFELETSLAEWNQSPALDMSITSGDDSSRARKRCSAVNGQMVVCNAAYGYNGWLGLASISIDSSGHITQGTAKMNDSYASYWADPNEKRHVMCQEIGHVFGLGHTSEDGSSQKTCMDYSSDPSSISPNAHDYELLSQIYSHTDSYNSYVTAGGGGGGGGGGGCNPGGKKCSGSGIDGREFGELVSSSDRHELRIRRGPDGQTILTHLYLAAGR